MLYPIFMCLIVVVEARAAAVFFSNFYGAISPST